MTATRGRAILLAFHYPPMLGPASARAASFADHLPSVGWEPVIVTARNGFYHQAPAWHEPPARTVRTRAPEPSRILSRVRHRQTPGGGEVAEVSTGPSGDRLRRFVRDYVYVPDGQALWIPFAAAAVRRVVAEQDGPTVLITTSVPYSAHLAGLIAARATGIPWVAEFRDPWALVDDSLRSRSRGRKWIDARLERKVVSGADAIVVTSEFTRDEMRAAHGGRAGGHVEVVRNGFETPTRETEAPPPPDRPMRLVYAGSVPAGVQLEPLLSGIADLERRHPEWLLLEVLGPPDRWDAAAVTIGRPTWLTIRGLVAPETVSGAVRSASATVLLCPGEGYHQHVAAKLYDYLGGRRPILGIVSASGEMAHLGREYGDMRLVPDYTAVGVENAVENLFVEHCQGLLSRPASGRRATDALARSAQVGRLAAVLNSLVGPDR